MLPLYAVSHKARSCIRCIRSGSRDLLQQLPGAHHSLGMKGIPWESSSRENLRFQYPDRVWEGGGGILNWHMGALSYFNRIIWTPFWLLLIFQQALYLRYFHYKARRDFNGDNEALGDKACLLPGVLFLLKLPNFLKFTPTCMFCSHNVQWIRIIKENCEIKNRVHPSPTYFYRYFSSFDIPFTCLKVNFISLLLTMPFP